MTSTIESMKNATQIMWKLGAAWKIYLSVGGPENFGVCTTAWTLCSYPFRDLLLGWHRWSWGAHMSHPTCLHHSCGHPKWVPLCAQRY